jgi:hypothetical protein
MDESEIYNIENYTERDLFEILDINNPTDRELEMSIYKNIEQYDKDREYNKKSERLYRFFKDMHRRFFDTESDDEEGVEGFEVQESATVVDPSINKKTNAVGTIANATVTPPMTSNVDMIRGNIDVKQLTNTSLTTHNVDYVKDNLNPIKRETMSKMISIDSQFRDDPISSSPTNFTMNLSSSIENVISIKLYSIQIPYTWYMVNEGFGSNFFYIKGGSPGINNGNHDIQVAIDSGNYTQAELTAAVNKRFGELSLEYNYKDVSFGTTKMIYNTTNAKVRFEIDIKKTYTEADYRLYFPNWTSPNLPDAATKNDSIASFLGYNYDTYYPITVYGNHYSFNIAAEPSDSTISKFTILTGVNDFFSVIQYIGPDKYVKNISTEIQKIDVKFSNLSNGLNYNRNELFANIKAQIAANPYFDVAYTDISLVPINISTAPWDGHSHYEISVKLNRKTTENRLNSKLVIIFPHEIDDGNGFTSSNFIWTGANSCFRFDNSYNELTEIVSETETLLTNYIVGNADVIYFKCTKPGFNILENEFKATIAPSIGGYSLSQYTDAINNALKTMNANTVSFSKPMGVFNIVETNGNTIGVQNTYFAITNSKATFQFDITRTFNQTTYVIDLSGCFLSKDPFFFGNTIDYLTDSNYTIGNSISQLSTYSIGTNEKIVLYPKTTGGVYGNGYGNQNQSPLIINLESGNRNILSLTNYLNNLFSNVVDADTQENILSGVNFSFKPSVIKYDISLSFLISKNLTETNYEVYLETDAPDVNNNWNELYLLNSPYNLANFLIDNNSTIVGDSEVYTNTIEIKENQNTIQFIPYYDGVYDESGANDITITIPTSSQTGSNYTRTDLINEINNQIKKNALISNSFMSLVTIGLDEYTKFRICIDKTYVPKDFKLVFYDPVSFSYCGVGTSGGNSIRTVTWDSTLGWLMGFHSSTEFVLADFTYVTANNLSDQYYFNNVYTKDVEGYLYSYNASNQKIMVVGDSILNTNLYNYFLIVLDDYIQNHVNDGLVTIASLEKDISLPTYASRVTYQCDPASGMKVAISASNKQNINLTSRQLYAMNEILVARRNKDKSYTTGPVLRDVFALVPLKLSGLAFGSTYMEFGGTLQNQDRKYFGPVRIQKFSVKLMNDKGDVVNLNGGNWSFTIICEIMVNKT